MTRKTVLVVGGSGVVGTAAIERFLDSAGDWDVVAVSRRRPEVASDKPFRHLPLDLGQAERCREVFTGMGEITHLVYTALFEKSGLAVGWLDDDYRRINAEMLRNVLDPLTGAANSQLEHVSLLQGTKAYGFHLGPMPVPAREREPRHKHDNFYWDQEDYVREKAEVEGWRWTVLRPHLVVGGAHGVAMNLPPVVGAYAAICREEDLPFGFPGGVTAPWDSTDSRVVAGALEWAATTVAAGGEIFNVTNGEVFDWRDLWPAIADCLQLPAAEDTPRALASFLSEHADTWRRVVRKFNLQPLEIGEVLGESHHLADLVFAQGGTDMPPFAYESTIKIRQAGFDECMDTEEMWRYWLERLMARRIIPPAAS
jgi:nucleoside-diphosphate-sugar epimerase